MTRIVVLLVAFIFTNPAIAWAQVPYDDDKTPAGWAWSQIRRDEIADFNQHCMKELDPRAETEWGDPCRQILAQFLMDVLTKPKFRYQIPQHGVRLRGAHIVGTIDLADTEIRPAVRIHGSRIEGDATLDDSRWKRPLSLRGSTIAGGFSAERECTPIARFC